MTENNARVSCKLENQDNELKKKKEAFKCWGELQSGGNSLYFAHYEGPLSHYKQTFDPFLTDKSLAPTSREPHDITGVEVYIVIREDNMVAIYNTLQLLNYCNYSVHLSLS